jgi:hypothetical protein
MLLTNKKRMGRTIEHIFSKISISMLIIMSSSTTILVDRVPLVEKHLNCEKKVNKIFDFIIIYKKKLFTFLLLLPFSVKFCINFDYEFYF